MKNEIKRNYSWTVICRKLVVRILLLNKISKKIEKKYLIKPDKIECFQKYGENFCHQSVLFCYSWKTSFYCIASTMFDSTRRRQDIIILKTSSSVHSMQICTLMNFINNKRAIWSYFAHSSQ